jgi:glycerol-3-phosphate dehydrogenase
MDRAHSIQRLQDPAEIWDVIVIGGGATGLGAAVEGAARGYKTLLVEQHDFAKGTSSRSTKLVHGGAGMKVYDDGLSPVLVTGGGTGNPVI